MLIPYARCVEILGFEPRGVLHIGAHHGEEAWDYRNNGVHMVCWIDANQDVMECLSNNTKNIPGMSTVCYIACLGDRDGEEVTFHVTNNGQSSSILPFGTHQTHYPHIRVVDERPLKTVRFDSLVADTQMPFSDLFEFVNLDIQGAELKVLKGFGNLLDSPRLRAVYSEINTEEVYQRCCQVSDLDRYLGRFGFERRETKMTDQGWGDALYVRKDSEVRT